MADLDDPARPANHARIPTVVLLGAGASVDAGLPTSDGLLHTLVDEMKESSGRIVKFVSSALQAQHALHPEMLPVVNVEDVFSAIGTLARRRYLPVSAFVGAWNPVLDEIDNTAPRRTHTSHTHGYRQFVQRLFRIDPEGLPRGEVTVVVQAAVAV